MSCLNIDDSKLYEIRVNSYLNLSPRIIILCLNHHYESREMLDDYQKFDFDCLIEAIKRSPIDDSQVFIEKNNKLLLNGPFRLDNHPEYGFGIHISWELKQGISKFQTGNHWRIIGG